MCGELLRSRYEPHISNGALSEFDIGLKVNTNGAMGLANVVKGNLGVWNATFTTVRLSQLTPYQVHEAH